MGGLLPDIFITKEGKFSVPLSASSSERIAPSLTKGGEFSFILNVLLSI